MKCTVHIVHGFSDGVEGGNPAGVVLEADKLSPSQKQTIASKVALSETAFASRSGIADYKVDFFTPNRQIPHCGHATIALFSFLAQTGRLAKQRSSKETVDGIRQIVLRDNMAFMEQRAPSYRTAENWNLTIDDVLEAIQLPREDVQDGKEPMVVNTGVNFMIIPLKNEEAVLRARPNHKLITGISNQLDLIGFYVFSTEVKKDNRDAGCRMFAPRYAIPEESATGMAAGPLACYLRDILKIRKSRFIIEQGHLMHPASPSELTAELSLTNDSITGLLVGGRGYHVRDIVVDTE